jgi:hypothetical protein
MASGRPSRTTPERAGGQRIVAACAVVLKQSSRIRSMLGREGTPIASIRVKRRIIKLAGIAGTIGPVLFGGVLFALSVLEYDFMLGMGWQPVADPAGAWPSGLALGPFGAAQIANFLISGLLLCLFAHLRAACRFAHARFPFRFRPNGLRVRAGMRREGQIPMLPTVGQRSGSSAA